MIVKEKLKVIDDKLKEMHIDGCTDVARSMSASNKKFSDAYSELMDLHHHLKRIANSPKEKDLALFDNLAVQFVELWGKVLQETAKKELIKYKDFKDIPKNVFRSCPPNRVYLDGTLGGVKIKIIPFRSSLTSNRKIVYTIDEIDVIREHRFNKDALKSINAIKHMFEGSYVVTPLEEVLENMQSNGMKYYERNRIRAGVKGGNQKDFSGGLQLPLEEQQRYSTRAARS